TRWVSDWSPDVCSSDLPRLLIVTADAMDPVSIAPAVDGADAVINAIGPRDTGPTTVIADSVRSIILAMDKTGTRRFVHVSGSIEIGRASCREREEIWGV